MKIEKLFVNQISDLSIKKLVSVKTSFEDEGADFNEVLFLKTFCDRSNIPLYLKISGAEAIRDIKDANKMQVQKLVAPMIESKFALEKFIQSCEKFYTVTDGKLGINVESKTTYDNIDDMFSSKYIGRLSSITVGRGDLVQSYEMNRYNGSVDSDEIFEKCVKVFTLARKHRLTCYLGGSMTKTSEPFVRNLIDRGLLDYFETRNVIYHKDSLNEYSFAELMDGAMKFELKYLTEKRDYYNALFKQDLTRIEKLTSK